MTDQHRATPEQWATTERRGAGDYAISSCLLELRDRIEALEAFDHHPLLAAVRAQSKTVAHLGNRVERLEGLHAAVADLNQRFSLDPLVDRIAALELALRAQAGSLTKNEQTDLGVVPVSTSRGAARHGADLAIRQLCKRPGGKAKPAVSLVNINDEVSVRLTDYGRSVIPHVDLIYMKTGADGWTKIQIHHFMRIFGPHIWSQQNVFQRNEILIYS